MNYKLKQKTSTSKYSALAGNIKQTAKNKIKVTVKAKHQSSKLKKQLHNRCSKSHQKQSHNPSSQKTNLTQSTKELILLKNRQDYDNLKIIPGGRLKNQRTTSFDFDNFQTTKFAKIQKPNKQYFGHFQKQSNLKKLQNKKLYNKKSPSKQKSNQKQRILRSYQSNQNIQKVDQYKSIKKSMKNRVKQLKTLQSFQNIELKSIQSKVSSSESARLKKIFSIEKLSLSKEIDKLRQKVKILKNSPEKHQK